MRLLLLIALVAVVGCSAPLQPSPLHEVPGVPPQHAPAPVAPQTPAQAIDGCTPTIDPDFPVSNQAEKVVWQIIEIKKQLREVSTVGFHLLEADATPRPIEGEYTEQPITGGARWLDFTTLPGYQSVDRREIAAGVMRWSTGVSFDIRIKGAPIVECLPETFPIWLRLDLQ